MKKSILIPIGALAAIATAALLLSGAINRTQQEQAKKVVEEDIPAAVSVAAPQVDAIVQQSASAKAVYTVELLEMNNNAKPSVSAITPEEAAAIAAQGVYNIYGYEITGGKIFAEYLQYGSGMVNRQYVVYIGGDKWEAAKYHCIVNAIDGNLLMADIIIFQQGREFTEEELKKRLEEPDHTMMNERALDPKIKNIAGELINKHYLGGRKIEEITTDGIQWVWDNPGYTVLTDCKVRMSEGTCYLVSVGYPDYQIKRFNAYPLGWHSCLWGYWSESEAGDYPALDNPGVWPDNSSWNTADGVRETPKPTPTPIP